MTRPTIPLPIRRTPAADLAAARKVARAARKRGAAADGAAFAQAAASAAPRPSPPAQQPVDPTLAFPAESAQLVAAAIHPSTTDPFATLIETAKAAGYTDSFAEALALRLHRDPEFIASGRELAHDQLVSALQDKLRLLIAHIDPVIVARMSGKDLVVSTAVLLDKLQLLQGKPTQIVDTTVRRNLDELLPAVWAEARRRGLLPPDQQQTQMIDVTPK